MGAIDPFLRNAVFGPGDITAMSMALEEVCKELKVDHDSSVKEVIAARIIELARRGVRSPTKLRDRLLTGATGETDL
jgi:hypothetical protein